MTNTTPLLTREYAEIRMRRSNALKNTYIMTSINWIRISQCIARGIIPWRRTYISNLGMNIEKKGNEYFNGTYL